MAREQPLAARFFFLRYTGATTSRRVFDQDLHFPRRFRVSIVRCHGVSAFDLDSSLRLESCTAQHSDFINYTRHSVGYCLFSLGARGVCSVGDCRDVGCRTGWEGLEMMDSKRGWTGIEKGSRDSATGFAWSSEQGQPTYARGGLPSSSAAVRRARSTQADRHTKTRRRRHRGDTTAFSLSVHDKVILFLFSLLFVSKRQKVSVTHDATVGRAIIIISSHWEA